MERAAFALAVEVARLLRERRGALRGGAAVVALVGPGSNGGDALHAGAELARRGVGVVAVTTSAVVTGRVWPLCGPCGGRVRTVVDDGPGRPVWVGDALAGAWPPTSCSTGSWASARAVRCATRRPSSSPCSRSCWPTTPPRPGRRRRGRPAQRHRRGRRRPSRPGAPRRGPHGDLRRGQGRAAACQPAASRRATSSSSTSGWT